MDIYKEMERSESVRNTQQRYYQRNREKLLAKQKLYDDLNREKIRERQKQKAYHKKILDRVELTDQEEPQSLPVA